MYRCSDQVVRLFLIVAYFMSFITIYFFLVSCSSERNETLFISEYQVKLGNESIQFELDSLTSLDFQKWRFNNEHNLFYFFNSINRSLYIYEIGKEAPQAIIPLEREGPNGIPKIDQVYVHDLDNIFILSEYNDHTATIINRKGEIKNRFILSNRASGEPLTTLGLQFGKNDFYFHKGKVYLTIGPRVETYVQGTIYPSLLIFDTATLEKEYVLDYPKRSIEYNFGPYGAISYGLLNPLTNDYIISFPYQHSLKGVNLYSMDEMIGTDINPFVRLANTSLDDHSPNDNSWYYYYHGWYDNMLFNPIDTTIWRMSTVGLELEKGNDPSDPSLVNIHGGKENFYTFIFDKNLQVIGYVKGFIHIRPILFNDGKMYKMVPNEDPQTAENSVVFLSFELLEKVE